MDDQVAEAGGLQEATKGSELPEMSTLASLPVPVIVTKLPGREIVFANAACQEALGRTGEQFRGLTVDDITAPEDRPHVDAVIADVRERGVVVEKAYLHGDGSIRRMHLHAITVSGFTGYAVALLFDITKTSRSLGRLKLLAEAAALAPGADIGIDTISATVASMATEHLGSEVEVVWFDEPKSILEDGSSEPVRVGDRLRCPIVVTDNVMGEVRVTSSAPDGDEFDDELLCLESLAHCLAGASSVAALDASLRRAELFERGFEAASVGLQIVDEDGVFLRVNRSFASMVDRTREELVGMHWTEVTHPDDVAMHEDGEVRRRLERGDGAMYRDVKRYLADDGSVKFGDITITSVTGNPSTDMPFRLVQVVDVTEQIRSLNDLAVARRDLTASELRYRSLVEPAPDAVLRISADGIVADANASAERIFEFDAFVGAPISDLLPAAFADQVVAMVRTVMVTGAQDQIDRQRLQLGDGTSRWFLTRVVAEDSTGTSPTAHVVMSDITQMVENEERLSAMARVDAVTGVANRVALYERLEVALAALGESTDTCVAVAAIGLDHFKTVNDSFGHAFGDEAIRLFARAVDATLGPDDMFGRLGGDEFLLVLDNQPTEADAKRVVERLADMITPLELVADDGRTISLSASLGLVVVTSADDVDDVIEMADSALLEAKRTGRGRLKVAGASSGDGASAPSLRVQLLDLLDADSRGEFELLYQPIIGADGRVRSVEALIRWNHPDRGQLTPDHFIDALIHSGRIEGVGRWVVSTAVRQIEEWDAIGLGGLSININVSPGELAHPGFCSHLRTTIAESSIDPSRIRIEITELALAGTFVPTAMLDDLSNIGARIVLDDFGTGVSSLSHLRVKSLSGIKIDKSFLRHAADNIVDRGIVEGMIALAHNIGVDVTVEGVETRDQAHWLASTGCEAMQGWLFSRAVSATDVPNIAAQRFDMPHSEV
jgi:diguanylate cyclase (GGDEF)-like protein/PAS domain S-box-containing protein